jgi:hypothetical protein
MAGSWYAEAAAAPADLTWRTLALTTPTPVDPNSVLTGAITDAGGGFYDIPYNSTVAHFGFDQGARLDWADFTAWWGADYPVWEGTAATLMARITLKGGSADLVQAAVCVGVRGATSGGCGVGPGGVSAGSYRIWCPLATTANYGGGAAYPLSNGDQVTHGLVDSDGTDPPVYGGWAAGRIGIPHGAPRLDNIVALVSSANGTITPFVALCHSGSSGGAKVATVKVEVARLPV